MSNPTPPDWAADFVTAVKRAAEVAEHLFSGLDSVVPKPSLTEVQTTAIRRLAIYTVKLDAYELSDRKPVEFQAKEFCEIVAKFMTSCGEVQGSFVTEGEHGSVVDQLLTALWEANLGMITAGARIPKEGSEL